MTKRRGDYSYEVLFISRADELKDDEAAYELEVEAGRIAGLVYDELSENGRRYGITDSMSLNHYFGEFWVIDGKLLHVDIHTSIDFGETVVWIGQIHGKRESKKLEGTIIDLFNSHSPESFQKLMTKSRRNRKRKYT